MLKVALWFLEVLVKLVSSILDTSSGNAEGYVLVGKTSTIKMLVTNSIIGSTPIIELETQREGSN